MNVCSRVLAETKKHCQDSVSQKYYNVNVRSFLTHEVLGLHT